MFLRLRQVLHHINHAKTSTASASTMTSTATPNVKAACCSTPAEVKVDYITKGTFTKYGVFDKAYVVGPESTGNAIIFVYDIFGYFPQTLQAADILADRFSARVVMPDFFHGEPFDEKLYSTTPPDVKSARLGEFFQGLGDWEKRLPEMESVARQLKSEGKTFIGCVGLCWGGRLCINAGEARGKWIDAAAAVHPPKLEESDGDNLLVPIGIFPSGDDQIDVAEKIYQKTKAKAFGAASDFKAYENMHHGWAGAHAHLEKEENYQAYADVYGRLVTFFENAKNTKAAVQVS